MCSIVRFLRGRHKVLLPCHHVTASMLPQMRVASPSLAPAVTTGGHPRHFSGRKKHEQSRKRQRIRQDEEGHHAENPCGEDHAIGRFAEVGAKAGRQRHFKACQRVDPWSEPEVLLPFICS